MAFSTSMLTVSVNSIFIDLFVAGSAASIDSSSVRDLGNNLVRPVNSPVLNRLSDKIKVWPKPIRLELHFGIEMDQGKENDIGIFDTLAEKVNIFSKT